MSKPLLDFRKKLVAPGNHQQYRCGACRRGRGETTSYGLSRFAASLGGISMSWQSASGAPAPEPMIAERVKMRDLGTTRRDTPIHRS
jgi:hypothetical protein